MSVNTYTPDSTKIIHNTSVDFVTRYINSPVHLVQFDNSTPIIAVKLYSNGTPYVIPDGMNVNVKIKKPDKTVIYNPVLGCNSDRNTVYIEVTTQMCAIAGDIYPVVEVATLTTVAASGYFYAQIDVSPVNADDVQSTSEARAIQEFVDLSKSWAIGDTGVREGEDTNNSKYWSGISANYEAEAQVHANSASTSATNASTSATNASGSATSASTYATNSSNSAKLSESWAIGNTGTRTGENTNNAKYYSEQASTYATNASGSATSAGTSATSASNSATSATNSKNAAASSATTAQSWAVGGTGTRTGEDTNNAKYWADKAKDIVGIDIATTTKAGIVKPDGTTITVDTDGTIHSVGGSGGTSDYSALSNKPKINNVELSGNKSASDLGLAASDTTYTKTETDTAITNKINALDVTSVGGTGKVITAISETDGKISATATNLSNIVDGSHVAVKNNKIDLHDDVTTKLSKLDYGQDDYGKALKVKNDGSTLEWGEVSSEFVGTKAEWNALSSTEKAKYVDKVVNITDDFEPSSSAISDIQDDINTINQKLMLKRKQITVSTNASGGFHITTYFDGTKKDNITTMYVDSSGQPEVNYFVVRVGGGWFKLINSDTNTIVANASGIALNLVYYDVLISDES